MPPEIQAHDCTGCGICVVVCPESVFTYSTGDEVPRVATPDVCWHCAACVLECPEDAIRMYIPLTSPGGAGGCDLGAQPAPAPF